MEARHRLNEVDQQLRRYRQALDAGADPKVVAGWIADAQARRAEAERLLRRSNEPERMTRDEIERSSRPSATSSPPSATPTLRTRPRSTVASAFSSRTTPPKSWWSWKPAHRVCVQNRAGLVGWCRRGDLNPHPPKGTRPST